MYAIQEFIKQYGIDAIASDLAIFTYRHPSLPLVGFKYSQIDSPKAHPVVREARGIVLEDGSWAVIAKPFSRFFNVGEVAEEFRGFDWNDFTCVEKVDGSLIIVYYYGGEWRVNTSGSFGLGLAQTSPLTWSDLFWRYAMDRSKLDIRYTYMFELCTPWNKVVKLYSEPQVFLLGVCDPSTGVEYSEGECDLVAECLGVPRPRTYAVNSRGDIADLLKILEASGEIHEGVVIRDAKRRYKWKTDKYVGLHHLKDSGNVLLPKNLCAVVLSGEIDEVISIFPDLSKALKTVEEKVSEVKLEIISFWEEHKGAQTQKDYALAVKNHQFSNILFKLRKTGREDVSKFIHEQMREDYERIAKKIFGDTTFNLDCPLAE